MMNVKMYTFLVIVTLSLLSLTTSFKNVYEKHINRIWRRHNKILIQSPLNNYNTDNDGNHNDCYDNKLYNDKFYIWKKLKLVSLSFFSSIGIANALDNSEGIESYKKWDNSFGNNNKNIEALDLFKNVTKAADRPLIYSVELTDPPSLLPRLPEAYESTLYRLVNSDCILLSHHNIDPNSDDFIPLLNLKNNYDKNSEDEKLLFLSEYIKSSQSYRDHKLQAEIIEKLFKINKIDKKFNSNDIIIAIAGLRASKISYDALGKFLSNGYKHGNDVYINPMNISNDILELAEGLIDQWNSEEYNYSSQLMSSANSQNQKQNNNFDYDYRLQISLSLVLAYLPVLNLCKKQEIKIVPVGVPDNIVLKISNINNSYQNNGSINFGNKGSINGLSVVQQTKLIKDFTGFVKELTSIGFQRYANQYLLQNFIRYISKPIKFTENSKNDNNHTNSLKYYYGLWGASNDEKSQPRAKELIQAAAIRDEGSATAIARASTEIEDDKNEIVSNIDDKQIIVLSVVERAIFGYGLQSRIARNFMVYNKVPKCFDLNLVETSSKSLSSIENNNDRNDNIFYKPTDYQIFSVLLNPTPFDSLSNTGQLRLSLGYAELLPNMKPLANYLWFDKSPNVKYLPRVKNGIKKEGEKPPGESSIIGAFGARNGNMAKPPTNPPKI